MGKRKKARKLDRLAEPGAARPPSSPTPGSPHGQGVRASAVAAARIPPPRTTRAGEPLDPFAPYKPPPGVAPARQDGGSAPILAMDDASGIDWARAGVADGPNVASASMEGQAFVGFATLALLAQRAEYRVISETIAAEMTRKWIRLKSLDGGDKSKKIKQIEAEFTRLKVRETFQQMAEGDGYFGRGHLFFDFGETEDDGELRTDIGDGLNDASKLKIKQGSLKAMRAVEAVWTYPQNYNSTNPLRDDWYKPVGWYVLGKQIHASRLLTFIGRPVPDLLKPAYAFAGLSMSQMAIPYVDNWLDTRAGVNDIIKSFSVFVLSTNATDVLAGGAGESFLNRLDVFNAVRDNRGVLGIDKEKEDFKNVAAPLGTLDQLQAQSQEHMSTVSRLPLVKLTGISPSGLNATSEGELEVFADHILAYQETFFRPNLTTVLHVVQRSLFGESDPDIGFEFGELVEMTRLEQAELRKVNAEVGEILVRAKAVASSEERARVIEDQDGPYTGLAKDAAVEFPMTENEKADVAAKVATTVSTLVAEQIIEIPTALRELRESAKISGFGKQITDEMISEAEADAAAAPSPEELALAVAAGADPGGEPAPSAPGATPKQTRSPSTVPSTSGVKAIA